ncbi:MAG: fused MFS/spermidine synthase [Magnetococcales bacterium]|nr:fused MFS/spermidine synthase [Magnetococcales bacterium]
MLLFAGTIFSSAFLLFLVQPIIAKQILPWFGGSSMVWTICQVFFQTVLLAGYAYADALTRHLRPSRQAAVHLVLLTAALLSLPIVAHEAWKPQPDQDPTLIILGLLLFTIGLPYFLLSTTGPLIQSWCANVLHSKTVYRLFSLSNLASLLALVSYPFFIEPHAAILRQSQAWSLGFGVFVVFCSGAAYLFSRTQRVEEAHRPIHCVYPDDGEETPPSRTELLIWLSLAGMGTWLLLAISNHITQNIASIPFLWILPLAIYLITFVFCFEGEGWYRRKWYALPVAGLLGACAWGLQTSDVTLNIKLAIPLYLLGLFAGCMFLHGELAQMKPGTRHLTRYYLMISLGGALGGMLVGLAAPRLLPSHYELGAGLTLAALLATVVFVRDRARWMGRGAVVLAALCAAFLVQQIQHETQDVRQMRRNFYGALITKDAERRENQQPIRMLKHGVIVHGEQYLDPALRKEPTTYYGPGAGVGRALLALDQPNRRVGVIGLGAGTLAVYGREGDVFRFYEINPQVIELAHSEFSFLADSAAKIEMVTGDARLSMEREEPQSFDLLAVDAFSGDSIPVHLLTREAMAVYRRHLKPEGVIAFHVTNRFLELAPEVALLAREAGMTAVLIRDEAEEKPFDRSGWVLATRDARLLERPEIAGEAEPMKEIAGLEAWTDDFNNLFDVLR